MQVDIDSELARMRCPDAFRLAGNLRLELRPTVLETVVLTINTNSLSINGLGLRKFPSHDVYIKTGSRLARTRCKIKL